MSFFSDFIQRISLFQKKLPFNKTIDTLNQVDDIEPKTRPKTDLVKKIDTTTRSHNTKEPSVRV
jgi:hypothetical protein